MPFVKPNEWFQTMSWTVCAVREDAPAHITVLGMNQERITFPLGEYLSGKVKGARIVHVTLSKTRESDYKLSVVCARELPEPNENALISRAIDLGSGDMAVSDSDGCEYLVHLRRGDKHWRRLILDLEARIEKCTKGSRSHKKRMQARRTMFEKMRTQQRDYQRKLAHALAARTVGTLVVGKMKTRLGLAQSEKGTPKLHWGAQNTGYHSQMRIFLKEKAEERGIRFVELPDPKREGPLNNPTVKFAASRALLKSHLDELNLRMPEEFVKREFKFKQ